MENTNMETAASTELLEAQAKFERYFGKHQSTRSPKQWERLVNFYGMETVIEKEKMTETEIKQAMTETFTQRLNRKIYGKV